MTGPTLIAAVIAAGLTAVCLVIEELRARRARENESMRSLVDNDVYTEDGDVQDEIIIDEDGNLYQPCVSSRRHIRKSNGLFRNAWNRITRRNNNPEPIYDDSYQYYSTELPSPNPYPDTRRLTYDTNRQYYPPKDSRRYENYSYNSNYGNNYNGYTNTGYCMDNGVKYRCASYADVPYPWPDNKSFQNNYNDYRNNHNTSYPYHDNDYYRRKYNYGGYRSLANVIENTPYPWGAEFATSSYGAEL